MAFLSEMGLLNGENYVKFTRTRTTRTWGDRILKLEIPFIGGRQRGRAWGQGGYSNQWNEKVIHKYKVLQRVYYFAIVLINKIYLVECYRGEMLWRQNIIFIVGWNVLVCLYQLI